METLLLGHHSCSLWTIWSSQLFHASCYMTWVWPPSQGARVPVIHPQMESWKAQPGYQCPPNPQPMQPAHRFGFKLDLNQKHPKRIVSAGFFWGLTQAFPNMKVWFTQKKNLDLWKKCFSEKNIPFLKGLEMLNFGKGLEWPHVPVILGGWFDQKPRYNFHHPMTTSAETASTQRDKEATKLV